MNQAITKSHRNGYIGMYHTTAAYVKFGGPAQKRGYVLAQEIVSDAYSQEAAEAAQIVYVFTRPEYVPLTMRVVKDWHKDGYGDRPEYEPLSMGHTMNDREVIFGIVSDKHGRVIGDAPGVQRDQYGRRTA